MTGTVLDVPMEKFETMEEMVKSLNSEFIPGMDVWEQLENENPDFSFFQDVHLESLIESLTYNGLTEKQILTMSLSLYGPVIDFYQIDSGVDESFVMAVGQR